MLQNIENWSERLREIESFAIPGNKTRILSLIRDIEMAKVSLKRLAGIEDEGRE